MRVKGEPAGNYRCFSGLGRAESCVGDSCAGPELQISSSGGCVASGSQCQQKESVLVQAWEVRVEAADSASLGSG